MAYMKGCGYPMTIRMNITFLWEQNVKVVQKQPSGFATGIEHCLWPEMQESTD